MLNSPITGKFTSKGHEEVSKLKTKMGQATSSQKLEEPGWATLQKNQRRLAKFGSKSWLCQRLPTHAEAHLIFLPLSYSQYNATK